MKLRLVSNLNIIITCSLVLAALLGPLDPISTSNSSSECFFIKSSDAWVSASSLFSSAPKSWIKNESEHKVRRCVIEANKNYYDQFKILPFSSCVNFRLSSFISRKSFEIFSWREIGIQPLYCLRRSCMILCKDL